MQIFEYFVLFRQNRGLFLAHRLFLSYGENFGLSCCSKVKILVWRIALWEEPSKFLIC